MLGDESNVGRQVRERLEDTQSCLDWQPMKLTQHWSDVVTAPRAGETSGGVLHRLGFPQQVLPHTIQQRVEPVQTTRWGLS